jgi:GntR family transcriptional regulator
MASPTLRIDPRDPRPIWLQIEEGLLAAIATRALEPGAPVLSVRELAKRLRVNPNTIGKVYQRLSDAGVLETRRGEGTFVAAVPPAVPMRERQRRLGEAADRFAITSAGLGTESAEALAAVERALDKHAVRDDESEESWR